MKDHRPVHLKKDGASCDTSVSLYLMPARLPKLRTSSELKTAGALRGSCTVAW
jgi:hypothetical protein